MMVKYIQFIALLVPFLFFLSLIIPSIAFSECLPCDTCPPTVGCEIECGQTLTGLSTSDKQYVSFTLTSSKRITTIMQPALFTDYNLIMIKDKETCPSQTLYDCYPNFGSGSLEQCGPWDLSAGSYYILVDYVSGSGTYDLSLSCQDLPCEECTLNVYVWDQYDNALGANIYVDGSYQGYNDHITVQVDEGTHTVEATKPDYNTDSKTVTCSCGETKRVDLKLNRESEEIRLELDRLDIDPDEICVDDDETIELSIPVTLESGPDNTEVTARFYVEEDDDWDYLGKNEQNMDEGQTKTFEIEYDYDADDLEEGRHDIKVVVEAGDFSITEYADLDVEDCNGESRVNVGFINLDPSNPDKGDIVEVKVYVTLESSEYDSDRVYVYAYIDDDKFYTTSKILDEDETESFRFTFDTDDYSTGSHKIKVKATVDDETDTSTRSFTIGKIFGEEPDHCLSIDSIRTDKPIQPGMSVKVLVDVMSCGDSDEDEVKAKIEAFDKTYYTGFFDIVSRQAKEVFIPISVPDDTSGKQTIKVTVWNEETSDTWSRDFVVSTGIPFIEIKKEFAVKECETEKITFVVVNTGEVSDTFTLKVTGSVAEWIPGIPEAITLEPDERKTITAYVSVPCDTELGYYEFTVTAEGSPKYSATSSIRVVKPWAWPVLTLPTGAFWFTGIWAWLPWLLLLFLIIFIVFLLAVFYGPYSSRRRPMFDC